MVHFEDIFDFDWDDTIGTGDSTVQQQGWIVQALTEIGATDEGQDLFDKIIEYHDTANEKISFTVHNDEDIGTFNAAGVPLLTTSLNLSFERLNHEGILTLPAGELDLPSLQRVLVHEMFHLADRPVTGFFAEDKAVHFTNEFMAKYYGEDKRINQASIDVNNVDGIDVRSNTENPLNTNFNATSNSIPVADILAIFSTLIEDQNNPNYQDDANNYFFRIMAESAGFNPDALEADIDEIYDGVSVPNNGSIGSSIGDVIDMDHKKIIFSSAGNDHITTNSETSETKYAFAGEGNDTIIGGLGDDFIDGGSGIDVVDYSGLEGVFFPAVSITADLGAGTAILNDFFNSNTQQLSNIEHVITGDGFDALTAGDTGNHFESGGGDDTLTGGAGDDTLAGGADNDSYHIAADNFGHDVIVDDTGTLTLAGQTISGVANDNIEQFKLVA